jgi:hypothetical protein
VQATLVGLFLSEALLTLTLFTQLLDRASVERGQHLLSSARPIPWLCMFTFKLLLGRLLLLTLDRSARHASNVLNINSSITLSYCQANKQSNSQQQLDFSLSSPQEDLLSFPFLLAFTFSFPSFNLT